MEVAVTMSKDLSNPIVKLAMNGANLNLTLPIEEDSSTLQGNESRLNSWSVSIVNLVTGQSVYSEQHTDPSVNISTEGWKSGLYGVNVMNGDKVYREKFSIDK